MNPKDEKNAAVDTTTTQPASAGAGNGNTAVPTIDYKAEAEALKIQLKKAEHAIVDAKKDPSVNIEEITNAIKEEVRAEFKKELDTMSSGFAKDIFEAELERTTPNPDERELIKIHYENTIRKTGFDRASIVRDIANAKSLANSKKNENTVKEIQQTTISKNTTSAGNSSSQPIERQFTDLTPAEELWVNQAATKTGKKKEDIVAQLMANRSKKR